MMVRNLLLLAVAFFAPHVANANVVKNGRRKEQPSRSWNIENFCDVLDFKDGHRLSALGRGGDCGCMRSTNTIDLSECLVVDATGHLVWTPKQDVLPSEDHDYSQDYKHGRLAVEGATSPSTVCCQLAGRAILYGVNTATKHFGNFSAGVGCLEVLQHASHPHTQTCVSQSVSHNYEHIAESVQTKDYGRKGRVTCTVMAGEQITMLRNILIFASKAAQKAGMDGYSADCVAI